MKACHWMVLGMLSLTINLACADEAYETSNTVVSGFGTIGGVYNSDEKHGFVRNLNQRTPPGKQFSWKSDSLLGVQIAHSFSPEWQMVGQALLAEQSDQDLNNSITRAFVSYRPTPALNIRLGRMADATFQMSDYADIGYAYPWVRPPKESYGFITPKFYDGLDVTYSIPETDGVWRIKGLLGRIKSPIPQPTGADYVLESNDMIGLALVREQGPWKARLGYSVLHLKNASPEQGQIVSALQQISGNAYLPAAMRQEAQQYADWVKSLDGARIGYASLGVVYDDGRWMFQSEVSDLAASTHMSHRGQQGYISLGRHFGEYLPYVLVGASKGANIVRPGTSWSALGSNAAQLQTALIDAFNLRYAQTTYGLGVRWDFSSQAALKVQWDHVRVREYGWGLWSRDASDHGAAGSANVITATIDFVF